MKYTTRGIFSPRHVAALSREAFIEGCRIGGVIYPEDKWKASETCSSISDLTLKAEERIEGAIEVALPKLVRKGANVLNAKATIIPGWDGDNHKAHKETTMKNNIFPTHTDAEGKQKPINQMDDGHLANTILLLGRRLSQARESCLPSTSDPVMASLQGKRAMSIEEAASITSSVFEKLSMYLPEAILRGGRPLDAAQNVLQAFYGRKEMSPVEDSTPLLEW